MSRGIEDTAALALIGAMLWGHTTHGTPDARSKEACAMATALLKEAGRVVEELGSSSAERSSRSNRDFTAGLDAALSIIETAATLDAGVRTSLPAIRKAIGALK